MTAKQPPKGIDVREATRNDLASWVALRDILWPGTDHPTECEWILRVIERPANRGVGAGTCYLAIDSASGRVVGILEGTIRSHADGCEPGLVAFMEGWVVHPSHQKRGVGRELARVFANWARDQGCQEIASDTKLDNEAGLAAHLALGFEVVDRCINFRRGIGEGRHEGT